MTEYITLWTLQEMHVWESLQKEEVLISDFVRSNHQCYIGPYRWMQDKMKQRIPGYKGEMPWWAWASPKPDLRVESFKLASHLPPNVRIELKIPREKVLVSGFDAWHCVLNDWYLPLSKEEEEDHEKRIYEECGGDFLYCYQNKIRIPEHFFDERKETWDRIFDLDLLEGTPFEGDYKQAVFEELRLDQVVNVTEYKGRYKPKNEV